MKCLSYNKHQILHKDMKENNLAKLLNNILLFFYRQIIAAKHFPKMLPKRARKRLTVFLVIRRIVVIKESHLIFIDMLSLIES